jgi:hypothetical protein
MNYLESFAQSSTVQKFRNLGERAIRFDAPWPPEILDDISKGDFVMIDWAPYLVSIFTSRRRT